MLTVKYRTHEDGWRIVEAQSVEVRPAYGTNGDQVVSALFTDGNAEHTVVCRAAIEGGPCAAEAFVENASGRTTQVIRPGG